MAINYGIEKLQAAVDSLATVHTYDLAHSDQIGLAVERDKGVQRPKMPLSSLVLANLQDLSWQLRTRRMNGQGPKRTTLGGESGAPK